MIHYIHDFDDETAVCGKEVNPGTLFDDDSNTTYSLDEISCELCKAVPLVRKRVFEEYKAEKLQNSALRCRVHDLESAINTWEKQRKEEQKRMAEALGNKLIWIND
jgi:hypothetical protein